MGKLFKLGMVVLALSLLIVMIWSRPSPEVPEAPQRTATGSLELPEVTEHEATRTYATLSGIEDGELVVQFIGIWESRGPDRGKVLGWVEHGTEVRLLDKRETDQHYYQIKSGDLTGWVSELFVTEIYSK